MLNWLRVTVDGRQEDVPLVAVTDTVLHTWHASGARVVCLCASDAIPLHIRQTKSGYALITNTLRANDHDPHCSVGGRYRTRHKMATPQLSSAVEATMLLPSTSCEAGGKESRAIDLSNLDVQQREGACHRGGPCLVIGPAGSGKTTMLVARIGRLVSIGVDPVRILVCTSTKRAAKEMKRRVGQSLDSVGKGITISTLQAIADQIVKDSHQVQWTLVRDVRPVVAKILEPYHERENPFGVGPLLPLRQAQQMIALFKRVGTNPEDVDDVKLRNVYRAYEAYLTHRQVLDFADLLRCAMQEMHTNAPFAKRWRSRWTYVMVDDFQDINDLQWQFLRALAQDTDNLLIAGDDDQSIDGDRGAKSELLRTFMSCYPQSKTVFLIKNHRSHDLIVTLADRVIGLNRGHRMEKRVETDRVVAETAVVQVVTSATDVQEARWLAQEVLTLRRANKQMPWREVAILCRTLVQSRIYQEALAEANIPYAVVGAASFYESPAVRFIIDYLRAALHPDHPEYWVPLLRRSDRKIPQEILRDVQARGWAALVVEPRCDSFVSMIEGVWRCARPDEAIHWLIRTKPKLADGVDEEELIRWSDALLQSAARFDRLEDFVHYVDFVIERGKRVSTDAVQVMTIYQSKGLEFETVFIPGLVEGLLPHQQAIDEGDVREETRLCYVAMTRAKENLYLLSSREYAGRPLATSRYVAAVQMNEDHFNS